MSRYPALMASSTERLHSSLSRTWKTPKPSIGILIPLFSIANSMMIPPVTLAFCLVLRLLYQDLAGKRSFRWLRSVKRKV